MHVPLLLQSNAFMKEGSLEPQLWGQWTLPFQIRQYVKLYYLA